jgi:hypothetical protein
MVSYLNYVLFGVGRSIKVERVTLPEKYIEINITELNEYRYVKAAIETNRTIKIPKDDKTTDEFIDLLVRGNTSVFKVGDRFYRLVMIYD